MEAKEIRRIIAESFRHQFGEDEYPRVLSYSGRGMYGETCLGFATENVSQFVDGLFTVLDDIREDAEIDGVEDIDAFILAVQDELRDVRSDA